MSSRMSVRMSMGTLPPLPDTEDFYELLGIETNASPEEIGEAYRTLAYAYHPDQNPSANPLDFTRLAKAHETLSNPVNRALYDLATGAVPDTKAENARIHRLRRAEAMQALRLMVQRAQTISDHERARNGLLIVSASYGDLKDKNATKNGRRMDVTTQMQSLVSDGMLILRDGSSKSWLEGFYDPTEGEFDNQLSVIYKFDGHLHQVTVEDTEELAIPREEHLMTEAQVQEWEDSQKSRGASIIQQKRRRRMFLYVTLTLLSIGVWAIGAGKIKMGSLPFVNRFSATSTNSPTSSTIRTSASSSSSTTIKPS